MKKVPYLIALALLLAACSPTPSTDQAFAAHGADTTAESDTRPAATTTPVQEVEPEANALTQANPDTKSATADLEDAGKDAADKAVSDAIDASLGDHVRYQAVILELQKAVEAADAAAVAALVDYPISVQIKGKSTTIKDAKSFIAKYADIMTPETSNAIVGTEYKDLFVNYQGIMFGDGQAWINGICNDDKCESFDVRLVTLQPASN